jgi:hypothetical protein
MGARIVQHSVPARGGAIRSRQLRRPGEARWRGSGAQTRQGGKTGGGEGEATTITAASSREIPC